MEANQIREIVAMEQVVHQLQHTLNEALFDRLIDAHTDLVNRFQIQLDITDFLTSKIVQSKFNP